jgi:hypothetical protein
MVVPLVLILIGVGQVIYGVGFRTAPVTREEEGPPRPPPMPEPRPAFPFMGGDAPPPPPPPPVPEKLLVTEQESELQLIREVSIGGVTRLSSGELKRTYTGAPPSLCPT